MDRKDFMKLGYDRSFVYRDSQGRIMKVDSDISPVSKKKTSIAAKKTSGIKKSSEKKSQAKKITPKQSKANNMKKKPVKKSASRK